VIDFISTEKHILFVLLVLLSSLSLSLLLLLLLIIVINGGGTGRIFFEKAGRAGPGRSSKSGSAGRAGPTWFGLRAGPARKRRAGPGRQREPTRGQKRGQPGPGQFFFLLKNHKK